LLLVIIFGPKDLEKMGKTIGSALFRFFNSEAYRNLRRIGELPADLVRKAGLDEFRATVNSTQKPHPQNPPADEVLPPASTPPAGTETENRIEPPASGGDKPL
jgi:Sec-independent protein translocase protein TatA